MVSNVNTLLSSTKYLNKCNIIVGSELKGGCSSTHRFNHCQVALHFCLVTIHYNPIRKRE